MKISANTMESIKELADGRKLLDQVVEDVMADEGEALITHVRDRSGEDSWFDQTGNLRSSVGYLLTKDGQRVYGGGFGIVKSGSEGSTKGKNFAQEAAKATPSYYALNVVAGMDYAERVESMKGKDVLASAYIKAQDDIPRMQKDINIRLSRIVL